MNSHKQPYVGGMLDVWRNVLECNNVKYIVGTQYYGRT